MRYGAGGSRPPLGAAARRSAGRKAMEEAEFPTILARALIAATPSPLLDSAPPPCSSACAPIIPICFAPSPSAARPIRIELTDSAASFPAAIRRGRAVLKLASADDAPADASVKGSLEALLALLEGRIDSDALFFTREIVIAGDTSAVVALRNVLDRETDHPARRSLLAARSAATLRSRRRSQLERRAERLRDLLRSRAAARTGVAPSAAARRKTRRLRAENETLKTRLSQLEARQRRKEGQAA